MGLAAAELAALAERTGAPILAAKLAIRMKPPCLVERPPETCSTPELRDRLPGCHDLSAAATQRLGAELGDEKPATWSYVRQTVEAVATRAVRSEVLLGRATPSGAS